MTTRQAPVRPYQAIKANAGSAVVVPYRITDDALGAVTLGTDGLRYRVDNLTNSTVIKGWTTVTGSPPPSSGTITVSAADNAITRDYNDTELRQVLVEFTDSDGSVTQQPYYYELQNIFVGAA